MSALATFIHTERILTFTDTAMLRRVMTQTSHLIQSLEKEMQQTEHALEKARNYVALFRSRAQGANGARARKFRIKEEEWAIRVQNHEALEYHIKMEMEKHEERYRLMNTRYCDMNDCNRLRLHAEERLLAREEQEQKQEEQEPLVTEEPVLIAEKPVLIAEEKEKEPAVNGPTLHVHLLSGDILSVQVEMNMQLQYFAEEFARQNHYNPSSTERFVFMVQDEKEQDEKEENGGTVFWSPEDMRWGITLQDLYPDGSLPLLHLFVRPMNEKSKNEKIKLLRSILLNGALYDMYEDDEIWSLFTTWVLTYVPHGKDNRYLTLKAFVEAHPQMFRYMNKQERVASEEWNYQYKKIVGFREFVADELQRLECAYIYERDFLRNREAIRTELQHAVEAQMIEGYTADHLTSIRHDYLTTAEMADIGVPTQLLTGNLTLEDRDTDYIQNFAYWRSIAGAIRYYPTFPQ